MSNGRDPLGDRMKQQYENATRWYLPRRTYTIMRLDGRAFHTFTRSFQRPFDQTFADCMDGLAKDLAKEVQGTVFAYVQSDEISLLLQDFASVDTQPWLGGNIQKMCSVAASFASVHFQLNGLGYPHFDCRVFTIPDQVEVANYFIWRQRDAVRNSILMAGQAAFGHAKCQGMNTNQIQEALFQFKQINWNDYPPRFKRGGLVKRSEIAVDGLARTQWVSLEAPTFTTAPGSFLAEMIPAMPRLEVWDDGGASRQQQG